MKGHSLGSAGRHLVSTAAREFALSDSALGFPELGTQRVILDYWLKKQAPKQGTKCKSLWKIPLHTIVIIFTWWVYQLWAQNYC